MEKLRSRHTRLMKAVATVVVCLFIFNTSGYAQFERETLAPELALTNARTSAEIQAAVMCALIEKRAKEWAGKSIEDIYTDDMLLWERSTEPIFESFKPVLSVDKTEITIRIPKSDITIRYYDPSSDRAKTLVPYTDWRMTKTHVINEKINRQIVHRTSGITAEEMTAPKAPETAPEEPAPVQTPPDIRGAESRLPKEPFQGEIPPLESSEEIMEFSTDNNVVFYHGTITALAEQALYNDGMFFGGAPVDLITEEHVADNHAINLIRPFTEEGSGGYDEREIAAYLKSAAVKGKFAKEALKKYTGTEDPASIRYGVEFIHGSSSIVLKLDPSKLKTAGFKARLKGSHRVDGMHYAYKGMMEKMNLNMLTVEAKKGLVEFFGITKVYDWMDEEWREIIMPGTARKISGEIITETKDIKKPVEIVPETKKVEEPENVESAIVSSKKAFEGEVPFLESSKEVMEFSAANNVIFYHGTITALVEQALYSQGLFFGGEGVDIITEKSTANFHAREIIHPFAEEGSSGYDDGEAARFLYSAFKNGGFPKGLEKYIESGKPEDIKSGFFFVGKSSGIVLGFDPVKIREAVVEARIKVSNRLDGGHYAYKGYLQANLNMLTAESKKEIVDYFEIKEAYQWMDEEWRRIIRGETVEEPSEEEVYYEKLFKENIGAVVIDWDSTIVDSAVFDEEVQIELVARIMSGTIFGGEPQAADWERARAFRKYWMGNSISSADAIGTLITEAEAKGKLKQGEMTVEKAQEIRQRMIRESFEKMAATERDKLLLPGVEQFLRKMKDLDVPVYVASRGTLKNKLMQAEKLKLGGYFKQIYCEPKLDKAVTIAEVAKKEGVNPSKVILIGDMPIGDMQAAKRAGAVAVGFAKDEEIRIPLEKEGVDVLISNNYFDIKGILEAFVRELTKAGKQERSVSQAIEEMEKWGYEKPDWAAQVPKEKFEQEIRTLALEIVPLLTKTNIQKEDVYHLVFRAPKDRSLLEVAQDIEKNGFRWDKLGNYPYTEKNGNIGKSVFCLRGGVPTSGGEDHIIKVTFSGSVIENAREIEGKIKEFLQSHLREADADMAAEKIPYIFDLLAVMFDIDAVFQPYHDHLLIKNPRAIENKELIVTEALQEEVTNNVQAHPEAVRAHEVFMNGNLDIIKTMLADSKDDILLRVPVEAIEAVGIGNIRAFLSAFQESRNGFVELYYMTGTGEVSQAIYQKYGIAKSIPKDFEKTKENTISLFAVLKGEISQDEQDAKKDIHRLLKERLGSVSEKETQVVPLGLQNDPTGLVRSTILGFRFLHIARYKSETGKIDEAFARDTLRDIKDLWHLKDSDLTIQDMIDISTGKLNDVIKSLNKLIKLMPIEPLNMEEIRQIFEHARAVMMAA